jgi:hypothetical protein
MYLLPLFVLDVSLADIQDIYLKLQLLLYFTMKDGRH